MLRAFLRDARHRNRFHIRRTKKGDIKATEIGKGMGIAQGVSETRRRIARSLDSHMRVYIIHTREKHEFIISTHPAVPFSLSPSLSYQ